MCNKKAARMDWGRRTNARSTIISVINVIGDGPSENPETTVLHFNDKYTQIFKYMFLQYINIGPRMCANEKKNGCGRCRYCNHVHVLIILNEHTVLYLSFVGKQKHLVPRDRVFTFILSADATCSRCTNHTFKPTSNYVVRTIQRRCTYKYQTIINTRHKTSQY